MPGNFALLGAKRRVFHRVDNQIITVLRKREETAYANRKNPEKLRKWGNGSSYAGRKRERAKKVCEKAPNYAAGQESAAKKEAGCHWQPAGAIALVWRA